MAGRVAIITDSTAYLSPDQIRRHDLAVVPLQVIIGGTVRDEGVQISAGEVARALHRAAPVTTSRPSPQRFADAYAASADARASCILSIHLSSDMSGTVDAARLAASEARLPVRVVDTRSIGMGLGFPVLAAAAEAESGSGAEGAAGAAERCASATHTLFYLDTLEHLRRGGRIGAAASLLGSALMMKPLLHIVDGRIGPLDKVRTASRAMARLEEVAAETAEHANRSDIAVQHLDNHSRADALAERLRERLPGVVNLHVGEVGAVIGAHVGPGMVAVVVSPR